MGQRVVDLAREPIALLGDGRLASPLVERLELGVRGAQLVVEILNSVALGCLADRRVGERGSDDVRPEEQGKIVRVFAESIPGQTSTATLSA